MAAAATASVPVKPSDALILGKIKNVDCVLLARHGRHHTIMPSNVNYRANIWALKEENCSHVLVTTACGSLREEIQPGDLVIIDQFIDRTTKRHCTLYDGQHSTLSGVCHIPMAEPFCTKTREVLIETAKKLGLQCHSKGTMITIEGPRFSSRAESCVFRSWGADVINMTTVPEVILAKEAGMSYASIAMATDYDCWKEHEEAVSVDKVLKTLKGNANKATSILLTAIPQIGSMEWTNTLHTLKALHQGIACHASRCGHIVPTGAVWTTPAIMTRLHLVPLFMQGTEKEKLLPPLLPFCLWCGRLEVARQAKSIAGCAKTAAAMWPQPPQSRLRGCSRHRLWGRSHCRDGPSPHGLAAPPGRGLVPPAATPLRRGRKEEFLSFCLS
ncbi:S-methyl-5'-thioadenosine phosphorylase isoform X2 [Hirundo rustica]|uniref:S-methyl-5'-thioadenosine phosphorylase isoform X2 n=1 Tax=Hirundo rustica TaxID=43150 RepID=UPI001A94D99B|nr:S-methyl-5'-thioadenosine phosphorylase isoform X2 [Hirundo rustica]